MDEVDLLPLLFGTVIVPQAVLSELRHPLSPLKVREWSKELPDWVDVHSVPAITIPALWKLDPGEREAIQLALQMGIVTVLMDETAGRDAARSLHLEVKGTLGILEMGAHLGKLDFRRSLVKLEQTSFRLTASLREMFLRRNP